MSGQQPEPDDRAFRSLLAARQPTVRGHHPAPKHLAVTLIDDARGCVEAVFWRYDQGTVIYMRWTLPPAADPTLGDTLRPCTCSVGLSARTPRKSLVPYAERYLEAFHRRRATPGWWPLNWHPDINKV